MTARTETYQGEGFTGTCSREVPSCGPIEQFSAPEAEVGKPQLPESDAAPPTVYCSSCNSKTLWISSRRVWCPSCKTFSQVQDEGSALTIAAVIGALLLLALMLFYVQGTFDHLLYSIGLNWETCGLSYGEILCGDKLDVGTSSVSGPIKDGAKSWF